MAPNTRKMRTRKRRGRKKITRTLSPIPTSTGTGLRLLETTQASRIAFPFRVIRVFRVTSGHCSSGILRVFRVGMLPAAPRKTPWSRAIFKGLF